MRISLGQTLAINLVTCFINFVIILLYESYRIFPCFIFNVDDLFFVIFDKLICDAVVTMMCVKLSTHVTGKSFLLNVISSERYCNIWNMKENIAKFNVQISHFSWVDVQFQTPEPYILILGG